MSDERPIDQEQIPAPPVPAGYEALTPVEPLLSRRDALWATLVRSQDGDGLLVLDESGRKVLFLVGEEAVSVLSLLLKWAIAGALLEACTPEYEAEHSLDVEVVRALLSNMQLDFVQEFLKKRHNLLHEPGGEEPQQPGREKREES